VTSEAAGSGRLADPTGVSRAYRQRASSDFPPAMPFLAEALPTSPVGNSRKSYPGVGLKGQIFKSINLQQIQRVVGICK